MTILPDCPQVPRFRPFKILGHLGIWNKTACRGGGAKDVGVWICERGRRIEDGRWRMEDGRWKMEDGGWNERDASASLTATRRGARVRRLCGYHVGCPTAPDDEVAACLPVVLEMLQQEPGRSLNEDGGDPRPHGMGARRAACDCCPAADARRL